MPHLGVCVLGPLQILIADRPVATLESDKARALLAYLAVESDRLHRREQLVGLLWPESPEDLARGNLRQALYGLRQRIGDADAVPPYLLISRDGIQFNTASDCTVDAALFDAQLTACARHNHGPRETCSSCADLLKQAIALYRGRFLEQFFLKDSAEFEEWAIMRREALHHKALDALERLANYYLERGEPSESIGYARRQLELDPWREEAHRQLMRALVAGGQRSEALVQYEACRRILREELGVEPSAETRELYGQIGRGAVAVGSTQRAPAPRAHPALPMPSTPFLGRERELAQLERLLGDDGCRLVTLVGPGGMGKTRLAVEAAARQNAAFRDGAVFIPLASVASPASIPPAIAAALGFSSYGSGDPERQVLGFLREKQMLLVVDNVEHLLEAAGLWVEILERAPELKLLLTSREALNLRDEWVLDLEGLPVPESDEAEDLEAYAASALFLQRARRVHAGFEVRTEERLAVARLCRLLGGTPLALELAATWVRTLSCGEIVQEIERSLDFLTAPVRDLPERHRSMRAVFEQSWKMLTSDEQRTLARLSIFHGGFMREAAENVAGASLPLLSALVAKSLVRRSLSGRYSLHELIRQYAAAALAERSAENDEVQQRHSLYYLGLLERMDAGLQSRRQKEVLTALTAEVDNLRAAWNWSVTYGDADRLGRASFTIWYLFELHNWFSAGETLFREAAETLKARAPDGVSDAAVNTMLAVAGNCAFRCGKNVEAYAILSACVPRLRASPSADTRALLNALSSLGVCCWQLGRFADARENLRECLVKAREAGERWHEAMAGEFVGIVAYELGDYAEASRYQSAALAVARQMGDSMVKAHVLSYLCRTLLAQGEQAEVEGLLHESLDLARDIGYQQGEGLALDNLGQLACARGRYGEARAFFCAARDVFGAIGATLPLSRVLYHQGLNALAAGEFADAREFLTSALKTAVDSGLVAAQLDALAALARLAALDQADGAGTDAFESALEAALLVLEHPSAKQEARDLADRARAGLEAGLRPDQVAAAQQRASSNDLNRLVRRTLAI